MSSSNYYHRFVSLTCLLTLCLTLSACGSSGIFRTLFTNVSSADIEFSGIKSGPVISAASAINPQAAQLSTLLSTLGQDNPLNQYLGVLMPVLMIDATEPRWILCTDEWVAKCEGIKLNAKVQFSGKVIGPGLVFKPTRLTAEQFDD